MNVRIIGMALAIVVTACPIAAQPVESVRTRVRTAGHATIWPGSGIARFRFCSRHPIGAISGTWTPRWKDVARFEATLPAALAEWRRRKHDHGAITPREFLTSEDFDKGRWEDRWHRNYIGIFRNGQRRMYVDFAPLPNRDGFSVCDGGPAFFGIEASPQDGRIVTLDANGVA